MYAAVVILAYFIVMFAISTYSMRRQNNVAEFFVAKNQLGVLLIVPLMFAEMIAGAGTVGNAATAFNLGLSSVWANWGMSIGCVFMVLFAATFYRVAGVKMGAMSVPEAYQMRFDFRTRTAMLIILTIVYLILFAIQPVAAASILSPLLNIDFTLMSWIVGAGFIYLALAGRKGIAWMNFVHAVVMYFGLLIVCIFAIKEAGGLAHMRSVLPSTMFSVAQPDFMTVLAWGLGTGISFLAASTVVAVVFGGKDIKSINTGMLLSGLLVFVFAMFPSLIGIAGKVVLPDAYSRDILYLMADHLGPTFTILASMGVLAAILSTGPSVLLIVATIISRDFYRIIKPHATGQQELNFSKVCTIILGLISIYGGLHAGSILDQVLGAFQIRSIAGLVLVIAVFWPRVSNDAAFWSMILGGITAALWHFLGSPLGVAPLWPSLAISLPVLVVLTLVSKEKISNGARVYLEAKKEVMAKGTF